MAIQPYLAMTPEEILHCPQLPHKSAQILSSFSWNQISALPSASPDSPLILTDQDPMNPATAEDIASQILSLGYSTLLLDFQKPGNRDTRAFAQRLCKALPYSVLVSDCYALDLDCSVFLSPLPLHVRLRDHIKPWKGRKIWLDLSAEGESVTLTEAGAHFSSLPRIQPKEQGHQDHNLHCHYSISLADTSAEFTLWRTKDDLRALLAEAESCGIRGAVGLYQELGDF